MAKVGLQFVVTIEIDGIDDPNNWEPDAAMIKLMESDLNHSAIATANDHLRQTVVSALTTFEDVTL